MFEVILSIVKLSAYTVVYALLIIDFKVADAAVAIATSEECPTDVPEGHFTAEFLFSFGATCLERLVLLITNVSFKN